MVTAVALESKMNRLLGSAALIAAGWTVSAQAADLPYGSHAPYTVNPPLIYSWAGPDLARQDRVALRRSRERQLHHHWRTERLRVRSGAGRRELSLLIATKKHPTATSRPLSTAGIFFATCASG